MDCLTPERRSWNMSRIRSAHTNPEVLVRSLLHRMGFRFRHSSGRKLPGKPDIVLPKHRTAIFVHGCFWHRHPRCRQTTTPKTRIEFWNAKFVANCLRDRKAIRKLRYQGWRVLVIWECEIRNLDRLKLKLESRIMP